MAEHCPQCGNLLPATAPRGFCPTCLLRGGLAMPEGEEDDIRRTPVTPRKTPLDDKIRDAQSTDKKGDMLAGRYRLGKRLGEGGFGVVYEAEQIKPVHRIVAVKILRPGMDTRMVIARFDAERQALAMMEHPGIARVLDAGETEDGRPFFVMERVHGVAVTKFIRNRSLPLRERLELFALICDAVQHAHQKGIIHRDLKPSNVLVTEEDGIPSPKLIDFGIAKALDGPVTDRTLYTQIDQVLGTPGYISPEQVELGTSAIDTRADVYALGSLLYEILCERPVADPATFGGQPLSQILQKLAARPVPRPSVHDDRFRGDLDAITSKAMAPDPDVRYASAAALADDVRRHLENLPILARPPSPVYLMQRFVRRHKAGVAAVAAVLLAVLGGAITSGILYLRAERARHEVQESRDELLRSFSRADLQVARQVSERGRGDEAVMHLCRALRGDPRNTSAATYLFGLLATTHLPRALAPPLKPPDGWPRMVFIGMSAETGQAVAVCRSDSSKGTAAREDVLCRWLYDNGERIEDPLPEGAPVTSFLMMPSGLKLVLGLSDGRLVVCDLVDGSRVALETELHGAVTAMSPAAEGRRVVLGTAGGEIQLWDVTKSKPLTAPLMIPNAVRRIEMNLDASAAVVETASGTVLVNPGQGKIVAGPWNIRNVSALALQSRGERFVVGLKNGRADLHDADHAGAVLGLPLAHAGEVTAAAFDSPGLNLVTGDRSGLLQVWSARDGSVASASRQMDGPVIMCQPIPHSRSVAAVSGRGEMILWNPEAGKLVSQRVHGMVSAAALSGDGTSMAMLDSEAGALRVWELHGRMLEPRYVPESQSGELQSSSHFGQAAPPAAGATLLHAWNKPGSHALVLREGDGVECWTPSAKIGTPLHTGDKVIALALSPDARVAATSTANRKVQLWDVASGSRLVPALDHAGEVTHMAFGLDSRRLVTVTRDGEFRCWDVGSGDPLLPPLHNGEKIEALTISADGSSCCFKRKAGGWFELPLPPSDLHLPGWFLDLAEAMACCRLRRDGSVESLAFEKLLEVVPKIPRNPSADEAQAATLARWLVSSPSRRSLWPGDKKYFAQYLTDLLKNGEEPALREVLRFDPHNIQALQRITALRQTGH